MQARRIVGIVFLTVAVGGTAWLLASWTPSESWPEPPRPAEDTHLDPELQRRIDQMIRQLDAAPSQAQIRARLGMLYEANELYPLAVETYQQLVGRSEAGGELRYRLARSLERAGRLDEAIAVLERVVPNVPQSGAFLDLLVDWLLQVGQIAKAEELVTAAGAGALPMTYSRVLLEQDRLEEAEAMLTDPAGSESERTRLALYLLAEVQRRRGDLEEAQATTQKATTAAPAQAHPWDVGMASYRVGVSSLRQKARTQLERGDARGALLSLRELRDRREGDDPRIASLMAQAYLRLGRSETAAELLRDVAKAHPSDFKTHLNLAKSALVAAAASDSGNWLDDALEAVTAALREQPDSAQAWSTRGQILEAAHREEEALASYRESWQRDDSDATARVRAAGIHLTRGSWAEARKILAPVTERPEASPAALLGRARAEAELGDLTEAEELLSRLGERLPAEQLSPLRVRIEELRSPTP
ncbi:MAG: tetratricopeptide repeat protein [Thermoanaerobaculia bacterium]|nr:tetratricopeptide repeat protein [Thermoanaerobaculia bacterium]